VTEEGERVHSFASLIAELSTITKSTCRRREADSAEPSFDLITTPSLLQARALDLLRSIHV